MQYQPRITINYEDLLRYLILIILIFSFGLQSYSQSVSEIVINEIMQNPSVVDDQHGEWFEIVNIGQYPIDLLGWSIKDEGTDFHTISTSLIVQPGEFIVLGNSDYLQIFPDIMIDYQYPYSELTLGNGSDELLLKTAEGETVDSVAWDGGVSFPDPEGASMALLDVNLDNSLGSNWTVSTYPFGYGELGTPGLPNSFGIIDISTNYVQFDTTNISETQTQTIEIYNNGSENLVIDSVFTKTEIFHSVFNKDVISPGDSAVVEILFSPIEYGYFIDTLTIHSDDPLKPIVSITLSGLGYTPVPHISIDPTFLSFNGVYIDSSKTLHLTVSNTGEDTLIIDSVYSASSMFAAFLCDSILPADSSTNLAVTFTPPDENMYYSKLIIVSNDPDAQRIEISLSGFGRPFQPDIYVTPTTLDFGVVTRNDTASTNLTIKNIGELALEIEEISFKMGLSSPFWSSLIDAIIIDPDSSVQIEVYYHYSDQVEHAFQETMLISSNDPDKPFYEVVLLANTPLTFTVPDDYSTIQGAINSVLNCDTILVNPGTYTENIDFGGKNIVLGSLFLTTGDTAFIAQTVIDGNHQDCVVKFVRDEDSTTVLTGFTITNGNPEHYGGGIYCEDASPQLKNLVVINNYGFGGGGLSFDCSNSKIFHVIISNNESAFGGGLYCVHSDLVLSNTKINGNVSADFGGGIYSEAYCNLEIVDCEINNNSSNVVGGGILLEGFSSAQLRNVVVSDNSAVLEGGGIACFMECSLWIDGAMIMNNYGGGTGGGILCFDASNITLINSLIFNNTSTGFGGGVAITYGPLEPSYNEIINSTIVNNKAQEGGGIYCGDFSDTHIVNSIIWHNSNDNVHFLYITEGSLSIANSDVEGGVEGIPTDKIPVNWKFGIDLDPQFVEPEADNYRLKDTSPCIGVAADSIRLYPLWHFAPSQDIEQNRRPDPIGSNPDMGAFENKLGKPVSGIVDEIEPIPTEFSLDRNYPNPFNQMTTIKFALPHSENVKIDVYNVRGEKVATILNQAVKAGYHEKIFDTRNLSSGIYFYSIRAGEFSDCKKMMLLK